MSPEYTVGLLGFIASLCAVPALIWAWRRRQLRIDDQTMYETVSDDEPDFSSGPAASPRRMRGLYSLVFIAVFFLICWMVVQTVRVASQAASASQRLHDTKAGE